jgi:hypothetical protein
MAVHSSIRSFFPKSSIVVWEYLVHLRSCEKWMSPDELDGVALLFESGRYEGFQWDPKRSDIEPIISKVQRMDRGRSVQYRTVHATERNVPSNARTGFPFRSMTQSMTFVDKDSGCEVVHDFEFEPDGLFGWLTCKLLIVPYIKRGVVQSHRRLSKLLSAV